MALLFPATAAHPSIAAECGKKCQSKREYRKARKHTTRHPVPSYIVACESHGNLRALNPSSGAGGRYQILPSTWAVSLPRPRFIRAAGGDKGPQWSSRLLQDRVALKIAQRDGLDAWSCA